MAFSCTQIYYRLVSPEYILSVLECRFHTLKFKKILLFTSFLVTLNKFHNKILK